MSVDRAHKRVCGSNFAYVSKKSYDISEFYVKMRTSL